MLIAVFYRAEFGTRDRLRAEPQPAHLSWPVMIESVVVSLAMVGGFFAGLPPAELAVHPADGPTRHELYLMCDDIQATLAALREKGADIARDVSDQGWGLLAAIRLPDGSELPIYEPRHPLPPRP